MNLSVSPWDYLFSFWGGVLVSFTPCIYPLIPVSVGVIGIKAAGSRLRGFFLSLVYVSGIAVTYSILGLFASLTGRLFGEIASHPWTYILVGGLISLFGLNMLGLFNLPLPQVIKIKTGERKTKGFPAVFLLGLSSGLVASPCVTPALVSILSHIATTRKVVYGMTLLMTFAYGMGFSLILAGTFSGLLVNIPRSGKWMVYIKRIAGALLLIMAGYFIYNGIERF
ncbi:MAG: cytochrome c biogenesis protein CcdA [Candidatus Omnitrophica bacterium]|jgi:thiol:disulfide interchange protein DsbD|nr:sulfite exporter TauE/SafE family protein [Candidatus Omnitrophota bacterium]MDD5079881.1 cytochrome c biogenesis protein CcdA [Candidatus Omnitrophota bacterium]